MQLHELDTPCLVIDERRPQHNIARMQRRMDALGVSFRPHVKTSKCLDVARRQRDAGACGITVSTLKEAEEFFDGGFDDILWCEGTIEALAKTKRANITPDHRPTPPAPTSPTTDGQSARHQARRSLSGQFQTIKLALKGPARRGCARSPPSVDHYGR
jgi:Alanine racemase, N-terminal domain